MNTDFLHRAVSTAFCCVCAVSMMAGYVLNGSITTTDYYPIPGAIVSASNDGITYADTTDSSGSFTLHDLPQGRYDISITAKGFQSRNFKLPINTDCYDFGIPLEAEEEGPVMTLEEIEVLETALKSYGDRDEMFLSDYNRNYGVNALDAISSLPRFIPQINGGTLTDTRQQTVNILIDGRPGTPEELRNLNGKDIAKVVYYSDAPAKFKGLYGGAIANIILKKPKEIELTGYLNAFSALVAAQTSEAVGLTLRTPSNYINASYNFFYADRSDFVSSQTYDYGNLTNSYNSHNPHKRGLNNNASLSWQFDKNNHMLYAAFKYAGSTGHSSVDYSLFETSRTASIEGSRHDAVHQVGDRMSVDLYYSYLFPRGQELRINAVGTVIKNSRENDREQIVAETSAYSSYANSSQTSARVNSLIADLCFSSPLWDGEVTADLWGYHRHVHQNYKNNFFPNLPSLNISDDNLFSFSASYSRAFGRLYASLNLSLSDYILRDSQDKTHNTVSFLPRLNLSYNLSRAVTLRMMMSTSKSYLSGATQNLNRQLIDTYYIRENIPSRENSGKFLVTFMPDFNLCSGRLILSPSISYTLNRHHYIDYIFREGDLFIVRPYMVPDISELGYMVSAMWRPLRGLQLRPVVSGEYKSINTPGGPSRHFDNYAFLQASYQLNRFQFSATLRTPRYLHDGITTTYTGWSGGLEAYWVYNNFYAGLSFNYNGDRNWTCTEVPGFSDYSDSVDTAMRHWVGVTVGYNFKTGRLKHSSSRKKTLEHSEGVSGL